jgi:hypothetical protein
LPYHKFEQNDVFTNRIKAHPRSYFLINNSITYYNNDVLPSGPATGTILGGAQGEISLYEMNINRDSADGLIYPFITKQGTLANFKTVSTETFQGFNYGEKISGSYPLYSTISTDYYTTSDRDRIVALKNTFNYYRTLSKHYSYETTEWNKATQDIKLVSVPSIFYGSSIKKGSVKLNFYIEGELTATLEDTKRNGELIQTLGPAGASAVGQIGFNNSFESSYDNKKIILENASGVSKTFIFDATNTEGSTGTIDGSGFIVVQIDGYEGDNAAIGTEFAIAVESVSGFQISTSDNTFGVITLTQDVGGTSGNTTIQDPDSILDLFIIQFTGGSESNDGKVAGVVLYNEGFVALTGSWDLSNTHTEDYGSGAESPKWKLWGAEAAPTSSWDVDFLGTNYIPTITMLAHAKEGDLNHSNNLTFIDFDDKQEETIEPQSETRYVEDSTREIANVVKSYYPNTSGSFEKTTYISKIGIYDENKNLIAIAKLATPVRKTESRS